MEQNSEQIFQQVNKLIEGCPRNWATQCSLIMGKTPDAIRKIAKGMNGKKDLLLQCELIQVLKQVKEEYNQTIKSHLNS